MYGKEVLEALSGCRANVLLAGDACYSGRLLQLAMRAKLDAFVAPPHLTIVASQHPDKPASSQWRFVKLLKEAVLAGEMDSAPLLAPAVRIAVQLRTSDEEQRAWFAAFVSPSAAGMVETGGIALAPVAWGIGGFRWRYDAGGAAPVLLASEEGWDECMPRPTPLDRTIEVDAAASAADGAAASAADGAAASAADGAAASAADGAGAAGVATLASWPRKFHAFVWSNGRTYIVRGDRYVRLAAGKLTPDASPQPLSAWGVSLPVDAIAYLAQWRRTYVLSGADTYWALNSACDGMAAGYPLSIAAEWGHAGPINAVLPWERWGTVFVFTGDGYYRLETSGGRHAYSVRPSTDWGVPEGRIDAAVSDPTDGTRAYLGRGELVWLVRPKDGDAVERDTGVPFAMEVLPGYPRTWVAEFSLGDSLRIEDDAGDGSGSAGGGGG